MTIQEKINAAMQDEAFVEAFRKCTTPEEVSALFAQKDIEVPVELALELFQPQDDAELGEDALDDVSGGGSIGAKIGAAIGNGVFYGAGYLGGRLAGWSKSKSKSYAKSCGAFGAGLGTLIGALTPW